MSPDPALSPNRLFLDVTRDPRIIPGVHHYCDEWCEMCPLTRRCLSFRCTVIYRRVRGRLEREPTFRSSAEAAAFKRMLATLEGSVPREVSTSGSHSVGFRTDGPLAGPAWEYAMAVSVWLILAPEELRALRVNGKPSPEEVILWFHVRIYLRVVRALAARQHQSKAQVCADEADGCAKVALVGIQRSRRAITSIRSPLNADTVSKLLELLTRLERGIDATFPAARSFVRPGIDVAVA